MMPIRPELTFRFYERHGETFRCVVCRMADGMHSPTCPIVAISDELQELISQFGVFLADASTSLKSINALLHVVADDAAIVEPEPTPAPRKPH
jgi:hypothetical protein